MKRTIAGTVLLGILFAAQVRAQEPVRVVVVEATKAAGIDDTSLGILGDVVREGVLSSSAGAVLVAKKKAAPVKSCDDACALKAAADADATHSLVVELSTRDSGVSASVKLYEAAAQTLVAMKRTTADSAQMMEPLLQGAVRHVFAVFSGADDSADAAPTSAPAPTISTPAVPPPSGPFYAEVVVTVTGRKDVTGETVAVVGDVYLNGRFVSKTPYKDGLPRGTYLVEVKGYGRSWESRFSVEPGRTYHVKSLLQVPLSAAEQQALVDRMEKQRAEAAARDREAYQEEYNLWKERDDAVRAKRRPLIIAGSVLLPAGVGLVIGGSIFIDKARNQADIYDEVKFLYSRATNPADINYYATYLQNTDDAMKTNKGIGIPMLAVGLGSIVTGIVLFIAMPKNKEKEPRPVALQPGFQWRSGNGLLTLTGRF